MSALLKPQILKKVTEEREVMVNAALNDLTEAELAKFGHPITSKAGQKYSFYAAMLVRAGESLTRKILTDYQVYPKMIPYVDEAEYSPATHILRITGGIWRFKLMSSVLFEEKGEHWIHFKIVGGHFMGLEGDIFFESMGVRGTAVYLRGEQIGSRWPPRFVIERGAEIVFGFTARRMRSYIENEKKNPEAKSGAIPGERPGERNDAKDKDVPQPRTRL